MAKGQRFSDGFREASRQVLSYNNNNISKSSRVLGISRHAVRNSTTATARRKVGRRKKWDGDVAAALLRLIEEDPELYAYELRDKLWATTFVNLSTTTVRTMMNDFSITRKKVDKHAEERYTEYNKLLTVEFLAQISQFTREQMFFVDESGIHLLLLLRLFGYARKGTKFSNVRRYLKGLKLNLLSAVSFNGGLVAFRVIDENTTTTDFNRFILDDLLPNVPVGGVIVLDNASIHKCLELKAEVEMLGRHLIFLPPYSPTFNPIELSFGFIKGKLQQFRSQITDENLIPTLCYALYQITPDLVQKWFEKCSYV